MSEVSRYRERRRKWARGLSPSTDTTKSILSLEPEPVYTQWLIERIWIWIAKRYGLKLCVMHNLSLSARHVRTRKLTSFNYVTLVNVRVNYKRCSNVIILRYHFRPNAKNIEFSTCLFSLGYDARTWNFDLFLQSAETNSSDPLTPSC